jgi:hypothetical protein
VEFGLFLKLMVSEARNLEDEVDKWAWKIQAAIENDAQLSGGDSPTRTPGPYESDCDFYVPNASGFGGCSVAQFPELVDRYRERQGLG